MKLFNLCAIALSICGAALATPPADTMTARFSAPFVVGETTLPAGNTTIHMLRSGNNVVLTFVAESGASATVLTNRINDYTDSQNSPTIELSRHGNEMRVDRVWLPDHTGFALLQ